MGCAKAPPILHVLLQSSFIFELCNDILNGWQRLYGRLLPLQDRLVTLGHVGRSDISYLRPDDDIGLEELAGSYL